MGYKELFSGLAIGLTLLAFVPYIRAILHNDIRPHVFSWIIWGSTTFVVFLAQLADRGGAGAWPIGVSGVITILIAVLAWLKRADVSITGADRAFFIAALSALLFWFVSGDPLWAVIILTTVDLLGFGPRLRKAGHQPRSESPVFFGIFAARNLLVLLALEHYSPTTALFPAVIAAACLLLIGIIMHRRQVTGPWTLTPDAARAPICRRA